MADQNNDGKVLRHAEKNDETTSGGSEHRSKAKSSVTAGTKRKSTATRPSRDSKRQARAKIVKQAENELVSDDEEIYEDEEENDMVEEDEGDQDE
jgi:hypothetical protein